jgi:hypothetical protein
MSVPKIITLIVATIGSIIAPAQAKAQPMELGVEFFQAATTIKTQSGVPAFATRFGFVRETDPDRQMFFQNDRLDATIQILSPGDGFYISLGHRTYESACGHAKTLAESGLQNPETAAGDPYWDGQPVLLSGWQGVASQSHIRIFCEQYGESGLSSIGIRIGQP